jgi:FAD/FMN-containing dehydrogenase/ferredoxin
MIGNNACGSHSVYTGKTVDNVDRLRMALYGGELIDVGADPAPGDIDRVPGAMLDALRSIAARYGQLVRERYPDIPRRVSGYNLDQLLPEAGFHVARALVGTESTCGIVTEATLRLKVSPRVRRLIVLGYPDIFAAADAVPSLTAHPLLALEGFDGALVDQMRARNLNTEHLPLLPDGRGWLLAEVGADTDDEADALADGVVSALPAAVHRVRYDDRALQQRVWLIRESGLAAMAFRPDGTPNHEGWEDAAVPPARLGEYLRAITALWDEHGYSGSWSGHFGQGCVHTRNNFELASAAGRASFRRYVERAADLVVSLGGSLSGEHGDGQARGELLGRMYGPELVAAFTEFKAVFDPRGRMNPGNLVHPRPLDEDLRYGPGHRTSTLGPSIMTFPHGGRSLQVAAERCVGVGRCRRDDTGAMCPSYRATRDERHSTRGRAKVLAELFQGEATEASWGNRDVRDALDLCLACKACAVDCPTQVDMAAYKAEFNAHYYRRRLRPRAMYLFALLPALLRAAASAPRVSNAVVAAPAIGAFGRWVAGVTRARSAPRIAERPFRRDAAMTMGRRDRLDATVVLWPDTFTDAFRPSMAEELVAILERVGERVAIPSAWACCGRTMYDAGFLGLASHNLSRLLDVLDPCTSRGIPVIVP